MPQLFPGKAPRSASPDTSLCGRWSHGTSLLGSGGGLSARDQQLLLQLQLTRTTQCPFLTTPALAALALPLPLCLHQTNSQRSRRPPPSRTHLRSWVALLLPLPPHWDGDGAEGVAGGAELHRPPFCRHRCPIQASRLGFRAAPPLSRRPCLGCRMLPKKTSRRHLLQQRPAPVLVPVLVPVPVPVASLLLCLGCRPPAPPAACCR